jgi:predicted GIY-YIG superfamily endonuclease
MAHCFSSIRKAAQGENTMVDIVEDFWYDQGPPVARYIEGLKKAVTNYAGQASCVYIGITGDIDRRTRTHFLRSKKRPLDPDPGQGWTRMVAIYNTTSGEDARTAEKQLIRFLRASPTNAHKCLNKSMGGELLDQYHHYYIYVLLGPASVRQAYWG